MDDKILLHRLRTFRETSCSGDCISSANSLQSFMTSTFVYLSKNESNQTTCSVLEDQLSEYSRIVDDRGGVNNFADATIQCAKNMKNFGTTWKSGLPAGKTNVKDLLSNLSETCLNKSSNGCLSYELPPKQLEDVFKVNQPAVSSLPSVGEEGGMFAMKRKLLTGDVSTSTHVLQQINRKLTQRPLFNTDCNSGSFNTRAVPLGFPSADARLNQDTSVNVIKNKSSFVCHISQDKSFNQVPISKRGQGGEGKRAPSLLNEERNLQNHDANQRDMFSSFKTAGHQLKIDNKKKIGGIKECEPVKKSLGGKGVCNRFISPLRSCGQDNSTRNSQPSGINHSGKFGEVEEEIEVDERLKNIDPKMVELIKNEIMDTGREISWDDIAGLDFAKATIQEIVVWPMLRPDIFTGLRRPPKGILLFGPPGTGKTLIGKCIASQSNSTFFSISASSLTSKWIGDGEKMVRALFAVARVHQPAVVFIDEIDSLLSQRSDTEHESSRRIKTEFLVQLDGAATGEEDRILIIGATNRPQELDEAARRRLVKRLYIPLPDHGARRQIVNNLMKSERNCLTQEEVNEIANLTEGYSGADMKNLCQEASLGPIRSISANQMFQITAEQVRPVNVEDFKSALKRVKSSVSQKDLEAYVVWDGTYGSGSLS